ncbi:MAG: LamB/YcsF family protein, partial [Deltaproteobacteria bacterium]|nr:LamB/YcsF family protein [Deltaproteobacteria bacterium]
RNMDISLGEIRDYVVYQIGALQAFSATAGLKLQHVKAHGALYNMGVHHIDIYDTITKSVAEIDKDLILVVMCGPGREELEGIGKKYGIRIAFESFADRGYNPDGTLVSRREPGAVLGDPQVVSNRIVKMVNEGKVVAIDGSEIELKADTVCLHGDNPAALQLVKAIRESCRHSGVEIAPLGTFL